MSILEITPSLLHKDTVDDVLIKEPSLVLPAWIDGQIISELSAQLTPEERGDFEAVYQKIDNTYVLRGIPLRISPDMIEEITCFEFDPQNFYEEVDDQWVLNRRFMPRAVQRHLSETFFGTKNLPSEALVETVSNILDEKSSLELSKCNSYQVHNTTDNYFFYRKCHEHVPGLMLIEVGRQAMYHYFYSYSGYKKGDVSISISTLTIDFLHYTESAYDVEVLVHQTEFIPRERPRHVDKTATYFQNGRVVGKVRLTGGAMPTKIFNRMRSVSFPESHWFNFSSRIKPELVISGPHGRSTKGTLSQISMGAIKLSPDDISVEEMTTPRSAIIYIESMGFVTLKLNGRAYDASDCSLILELDESDNKQRHLLGEIIKAHCFYCKKQFPIYQNAEPTPAYAARA